VVLDTRLLRHHHRRQVQHFMKNPMKAIARRVLRRDLSDLHQLGRHLITATARAVQLEVGPGQETLGKGHDWRPSEYGDYYAQSIPVYAAINIRADALARLPWRVTVNTAAQDTHPAAALLNDPNPYQSGPEFLAATEINLCLWGAAFWVIELTPQGFALWNIPPHRMKVIPGSPRSNDYIRGYRYEGPSGEASYLPEEVVFFRRTNPLEDRTGLSPLAPLRLSADMGRDALRYNRNTFKNGGVPDIVLMAEQTMTQGEVDQFYKLWEQRFAGPEKSHRPAIASNIKAVEKVGLNARDAEFVNSITLAIRDAARVYGVPSTMLEDREFATLNNAETDERKFWRQTVTAEARYLESQVNTQLLPRLGYYGVKAELDLSGVEALQEGEEQRVKRESEYLDRGVITINEVRQERGLPPVPWGNEPMRKPTDQAQPEKPGSGEKPADQKARLERIITETPAWWPVNGQHAQT
jgi:HK97 family phage portal protein